MSDRHEWNNCFIKNNQETNDPGFTKMNNLFSKYKIALFFFFFFFFNLPFLSSCALRVENQANA